MASSSVLSDGCLDMILQQKNDRLNPIVQILGTKMLANNRIRAVISDGVAMCQHCIFISEEIDQQYNDGLLSKFTVVRLDQYTISSLPKKENMPVILVNKMTILKQGEEIDHKLNPNEPYEETEAKVSNAASSALSSSSFNRPAQPAQPKPAPKPSIVAGGPNTLKSENVCPINVLTPFFNAWVLRVRVTSKTPLKTYSNKKGEGKLFSFDCCDESGEIRITGFNTECDKYFDLIQPNKMYYISKGSIKSANKRFSSLNNDYEITLNQGSVIELCQDTDDSSIPKLRFKFINLAEMANINAGTMIDVIGVIRHVGQVETLVSKKTAKELTKKEFSIVDKPLGEARVTLWNEVATGFNGDVGQIVAMKGVLVGDFKGKTLSTSQSTVMQIEPDIPETLVLRNWYNSQGSTAKFTSLNQQSDASVVSNSQRVICQINPKLVAGATGQTYSSFNGIISATNRSNNHLYKSCGFNGCQKKVTDENEGMYHCSKCDRDSPTFQWRLMLSLNVADSTGSMWITVFQENGEKLLGRSSQELAELYEMDQTEYIKVINSIRFKDYYFRVGSRLEEYNNEQRLRSSAYTIAPHEPVARARRLMPMIDILAKQVSA